MARAVFSIIDSTIEANAGSGIHIGSSVQLDLRRSRIINNGGDGLLVWDQATVHIEENAFLNNMQTGVRLSDPSCPEAKDSSGLHSFAGTVTGWENVIPASNEIDGNADGSICPLMQYRYLVEPHL